MLSYKNFRSLVFVAAIAFMLMAITSVEAIPTGPDALRCVECPKPPRCIRPYCSAGYYCYENECACRTECKKGQIPI
ncbi:MAG: hypothetical protein JOS17DRAFT_749059 [Linnemannia elongata]|nr:MAG: hypothetical protein JOS17DRAFT_749059 [Linnemannia elongata]